MNPELTDEEKRLIADIEFIKRKRRLFSKLDQSFLHIQTGIEQKYFSIFYHLIQTNILKGKVSRGENLEEMPYLVLDCPSVFDKTNIFTCRAIFWWGHFFGFHWLLTGDFLSAFQMKCVENLELITHNNGWLSIAKDPWDHNIGGSGYQKSESMKPEEWKKVIENKGYLKISWPLPLERYSELDSFIFRQLDVVISILSN